MEINNLLKKQKRLRPDRTYSVVPLRMPDDVIADLQRVAPQLGIPDYQTLICYYIGKSLHEDLARLKSSVLEDMICSLKRQGISEEVIHRAIVEMVNG
jgi:hypothetical protein